ncbi:MAG: hypothetical protein L6Q75_15300 [Burkholderiaceae bacterium]|nr:hypothetical protein [Burkholderiaceae bacterium]
MVDVGGPGQVASPASPVEGRAAVQAALREWMQRAADEGWRELWLCDADLAQWPIGEAAWVALLQRWAAPQRRLILLLADDAALQRLHPRWVAWRRTWSHRVDLRVVAAESAGALRACALAPGHSGLELLSPWQARWLMQPAEQQALLHELRALHERAAPGWPAHALGL